MTALSRAALMSGAIDARHASPSPRPIEILQIGEGVFLRAFVDWMVDVANEKGVYAGGVAVAAPRRHERPPALVTQDCLYTVLLRGREGGRDISERRIVTTVQTALDPYAQWSEMLRLAASPALKFLVSNTTEAGIVDAPEAYDPAVCPDSFPAKVAALLKARFDALGGLGCAGPGRSSLRAHRRQRRDAAADRARARAALGLRCAPASPGSETGAASSTRSSTGSCQASRGRRRRAYSPNGAIAIRSPSSPSRSIFG